MRKMLFLFLCFPLYMAAQWPEIDSFNKSVPAGLGKPIHMPETDYNPDFNLDNLFPYRQKTRVYEITEDSVYRKLFRRYIFTKDSLRKYKESTNDPWQYSMMESHLVDSVPAIDFSKNVLVVYSACPKCLEVCYHAERDNESCHRAACYFREVWFIKEKEYVTAVQRTER